MTARAGLLLAIALTFTPEQMTALRGAVVNHTFTTTRSSQSQDVSGFCNETWVKVSASRVALIEQHCKYWMPAPEFDVREHTE